MEIYTIAEGNLFLSWKCQGKFKDFEKRCLWQPHFIKTLFCYDFEMTVFCFLGAY